MPAFNQSSALMLKTAIDSGITDPKELANIMGNASVETAGFKTMHERLNYSSAENLIKAVSSTDERFSMKEIREAIASKDPQRIATMAYENRKDLGNTEPGDGWRFHGRGYFQYTGRDNYERYGEKFGVDLANNPDQAADPKLAAKLAVAYWKDKVPESLRDDPRRAGAIINGGPNGADARVERSQSWSKEITPELVEGVRSGKISLDQLATMGTPEPSKKRAAMADGMLSQGERGPEVKALQKDLTRLGIDGPGDQPLNPDGRFGPGTKHAVEEFQRTHGLKETGVADKETLKAIKQAVQQQDPAAPTRPAQPDAATPQRPASAAPERAGAALLSDPRNPDHGLYKQAMDGLDKLGSRSGLNAEQKQNAAAMLAYEAKVSGLDRIDHVALSQDGKKMFAVEGGLQDPSHKRIVADTAQAAAQPVAQTSRAIEEDAPAKKAAPEPSQQQSRPMQV